MNNKTEIISIYTVYLKHEGKIVRIFAHPHWGDMSVKNEVVSFTSYWGKSVSFPLSNVDRIERENIAFSSESINQLAPPEKVEIQSLDPQEWDYY